MKTICLTITVVLALAYTLPGQEISPYLFGQNHWMDKSDEGRRPGYLYMLWPQIKESGVKSIRIGGGGYQRRLPSRDKLIAIVDNIQRIGAEPILQVPSHYSAEDAGALVEQFNKSDRTPVRYWSIGNEPLLHDRGGIEKVYDYVRRIAPAMKAIDPSIKIFVFDECTLFEEPHQRIVGGDLDLTGKDPAGNWLIDGITFHRYPNTRSDFDRGDVVFNGPRDIRRQIEQLKGMIELANKKHGRTGDACLSWGLTEFNVTTSNPDRDIAGVGNTSFLAGQFFAEIYGLGMEYGAFTMAPWCINETDRLSTDFGFLGLPPEFHPRSSFYHTQMMVSHMRGKFLPTTSNERYLKTIGSRSYDTICIMLLNRDQVRDFDFDLILNSNGESDKTLVVHADVELDVTVSGRILHETTVLLVLSTSGKVKKQYTYGLTHNLKHQPPEVK